MPAPSWGGRLAVALVYPNTYFHGMSNLGFQFVHHFLNSRQGTLCERFFLPDPQDAALAAGKKPALAALESGRPLADFDLICFSISFENDYPNILKIMDDAGMPLRSADRSEKYPLILGGGIAPTLNPEPLADFFRATLENQRKNQMFQAFVNVLLGKAQVEIKNPELLQQLEQM